MRVELGWAGRALDAMSYFKKSSFDVFDLQPALVFIYSPHITAKSAGPLEYTQA